MKYFATTLLFAALAITAAGQQTRPTPKKTPRPTPKPAKTVVPTLGTETEEFEKAKAVTDASERIRALEKFIADFPQGTEIGRARGLIVSARAVLAEEKLNAGDVPGASALFAQAVNDAPSPIPDDLFDKVILGFPLSLRSRGQVAPAFDIVKLIEEKAGSNAGQILDLAKFFITIQYGTEAIRLAEKSIAIDPTSAAAHQTLAVAYKMNFRLDDAAASFAKALELDASSTATRQNLAEIKRALGKTDEALALYRETLALDKDNGPARTGLILALFESGKRSEAEIELKAAMETMSGDPALLTGVAYWYASAGDAENAALYSRMAISADPSNVWAYIAQARGLLIEKKALDAERVLLGARQYADIPTLDYELASARIAAGLFREAADTLKRNFTVNADGLIETYLGNRILADASSFTDLLSLERRSLIANRSAADDGETARQLKSLLELTQKFEKAETPEAELVKAVDQFAAGSDSFRLYRQMYAANRLLARQIAPAKALELMQAAIGGVEAALNVPSPTAAVLADDLYDSRQYFIARSQVVSVNELPRQKLSAILRGRIEETAGWALLSQENSAQAIIRLKRALTVLPEKSTWWRSSWRRLGAAYLAAGNEPDALEAYIKAYDTDQPNREQRIALAALWLKVKGTNDGLDARIGADPFAETVAKVEPTVTPSASPEFKLPQDIPLGTPTPGASPETAVTPKPEPSVEATPSPIAETTPSPSPEIAATPTPEPSVVATPTPVAETTPTPSPEPTPETTPEAMPTASPEIKSTPTPEPTVEATPTPTPEPTVEATPTPAPETSPTPLPEPTPETKAEPTPESTPTPEPTPVATPTVTPTPEPTPDATPTPAVELTPTPTPSPEASPSPTPKPLFDPIVITVGNPPKTEPTPDSTPEAKPSPSPATDATPAPTSEPTPQPTTDKPSSPETSTNPNGSERTGEIRQRVVRAETPIVPCTIVLSQESISIIAGGGSLGILAGFDDDVNDPATIESESASPSDVDVSADRSIGFSSRRAFFVVRSRSDKTGIFSVTFRAPCGKKEIQVRVR